MAWYFNCSPKAQAVPTGDGNVISVRPNTHVEVFLETEALRRLVKRNKIVRSGRPVHKIVPRAPYVEAAEIEVERKPFAQQISEQTETRKSPPNGEEPAEPSEQLQLDVKVDTKRKERRRR